MSRFVFALVLALAVTLVVAQPQKVAKRVSVGCEKSDPSLSLKDAICDAADGTTIEVCGEIDLGCTIYVRNVINLVAHKKTGATLEDLTLKFKSGSEGSTVTGFHFKDAKIIGKADQITVKDNTFSCTWEPISVYGRDGWVISGNTFKWGSDCSYAIGFEGDIFGATIEKNTIDGSFGAGIVFEDCGLNAAARGGGGSLVADVVISKNTFVVDQALYFDNGGYLYNLAIDGNTFSGDEGVYLGCMLVEGLSVSKNTFECGAGVELEDVFLIGGQINKNQFVQWHHTAIKFEDSAVVLTDISENVVEASKYGIKIQSDCGNDAFFAGNTVNKNTISGYKKAIYIKEDVKVCETQFANNRLQSCDYAFVFDGSAFIHNQVANNKYDAESFYKLSDSVCRVVDSDFFQNTYVDFEEVKGKGKGQQQQELAAIAEEAAKTMGDEEDFFAGLRAKRVRANAAVTLAKFAILDDGEEEDEVKVKAASDVDTDMDAIMRAKLTEALSGLPEAEVQAIVEKQVSEIRAEMLNGFRVNHSGLEAAAAQHTSGNKKMVAAVASFAVGLVATLLGVAIYRRGRKNTYSAL